VLTRTKVYSDDTAPYGPINFLTTTWKASAELSGHAQQDAHEFFISALNQIHSTSRGSTNVSCNCVVHSTFSGQLQSDVKCERCGNITSTVDPMMDISLEINKNTNGRSGSVAVRNSAGVETPHNDNTLTACLNRYVFTDVGWCHTKNSHLPCRTFLGSLYINLLTSDSIRPIYLTNHVLWCSDQVHTTRKAGLEGLFMWKMRQNSCMSKILESWSFPWSFRSHFYRMRSQEASKRLSIRKLPPVLVFQFKV